MATLEATVVGVVGAPAGTTTLPTTPTVERALDLIAQNSDRSHGLPAWAQVALPLIAAVVAISLYLAGRQHDREMRVKDDVRRELVGVFEVVSDAQDTLSKATLSTYGLDSYWSMTEMLAAGEIRPTSVAEVQAELERRASNLREEASDYRRAVDRLVLRLARVELLCPPEAHVLRTFKLLVRAFQVADWWVRDLHVYPGLGDK